MKVQFLKKSSTVVIFKMIDFLIFYKKMDKIAKKAYIYVMTIKKQFKKLPDSPGIYLFYNSKKELIYVGKASSLKSRVRSYFAGSKTARPIEQMVHEIVDIKWKETDSILEAIILEANYINKFKPKYNIVGKDDKSWNYIVITKDMFPLVRTMRGRELEIESKKRLKIEDLRLKKYAYIFGPYPGLKTKEMMGLLRKLFLYSDCRPNQKRPCFYYNLKQCLGVCTGEISPTEYKRIVIRPLVTFLRGGKKRLITTLKKRMKLESKNKNFEEAARLRNQIAALKRIQDVALLDKNFVMDKIESRKLKVKSFRIEGYDISNLGKTGKVGSMVVFDGSGPVKSEYRKFKIKTVQGQSDVDCLAEVLERRLKHKEWTFPDIILVDGGRPQVNIAKKILKQYKVDISIVGIAKGPGRKKNEIILGNKNKIFKDWIYKHTKFLINVRDEAHRFAISYQKQLRKIR